MNTCDECGAESISLKTNGAGETFCDDCRTHLAAEVDGIDCECTKCLPNEDEPDIIWGIDGGLNIYEENGLILIAMHDGDGDDQWTAGFDRPVIQQIIVKLTTMVTP